MELNYLIEIGIILLSVTLISIILITLSHSGSKSDYYDNSEDEKRRYGKSGEQFAVSEIKKILHADDLLFANVKFCYDNKPAELDCVIVNKYGVFIIEIKNYFGRIIGNENDYKWKKYKTTDAGITYEKEVTNPIIQIKRQVYLLAKYLRYYGVNVWVKGYAFLINCNSPVKSEGVLSSIAEIDKTIHTSDRPLLSKNTIAKIKQIIS